MTELFTHATEIPTWLMIGFIVSTGLFGGMYYIASTELMKARQAVMFLLATSEEQE